MACHSGLFLQRNQCKEIPWQPSKAFGKSSVKTFSVELFFLEFLQTGDHKWMHQGSHPDQTLSSLSLVYQQPWLQVATFIFCFLLIFMYLAVSGFSSGMQDPHCIRRILSLGCTSSLVVVYGAYLPHIYVESWLPWPGIKPTSFAHCKTNS